MNYKKYYTYTYKVQDGLERPANLERTDFVLVWKPAVGEARPVVSAVVKSAAVVTSLT